MFQGFLSEFPQFREQFAEDSLGGGIWRTLGSTWVAVAAEGAGQGNSRRFETHREVAKVTNRMPRPAVLRREIFLSVGGNTLTPLSFGPRQVLSFAFAENKQVRASMSAETGH
jgi:hypothetical protein